MAFQGFGIPAGGPVTIADNATGSSQTIFLTPIWRRIVSLDLTLTGLQHTFSADLDFLLLTPSGGGGLVGFEFWSDAGGNTAVNGNYIISDSAASVLSEFAAIPGTYRPADYPALESSSNWAGLAAANVTINHATPDGTATFGSVFGGRMVVSTSWSLYIRDDNTGDSGTLASWSISGTAAVIVKPNDFNGNGNSDILWQHRDGTPGIWSMTGGFKPAASGAVGPGNPGPNWHIKDGADFNGDGRSDILWQHDDGTAGIWFMDGLTVSSFGVAGPVNPGPSWRIKAADDFNFDTKADILWQNSDGTPAIWLMDGLNLISGGVVGPANPGPSWHVEGTGDFNFDGMSDILWQNSDGTPAIWLMNGLNIISGGVVGPANPGPSWHVQGSGEYNGDGRSDILWQHDDGTPAIWFMNGLSLISGGVVGSSNPGADWHMIA